jgi:hypothetical protein
MEDKQKYDYNDLVVDKEKKLYTVLRYHEIFNSYLLRAVEHGFTVSKRSEDLTMQPLTRMVLFEKYKYKPLIIYGIYSK